MAASNGDPGTKVVCPQGFRFGATAAGIRESGAPGRRDLAAVVSEVPCAAAGVFTVNRMRAAPVEYAAGRLPAMGIRAIVANSGNANAIVGPRGAVDERAVAAAAAAALKLTPDEVLTASTGAIGSPLPVERMRAAMPALASSLATEPLPAAEAIRTTDLRTKMAARTIELDGKPVQIVAICKGSGMIHPQMATMLCFIATDASVSPGVLQAALIGAVEDSFNAITVDGDMSTNDCVIALANGRSGMRPIEGSGAELERFAAALREICFDLARAIAADGEGASKLLVVDVEGTRDHALARDLARAVAGGSLVKSGIFGGDPSWGRILAALGARIGARDLDLDLSRLTLDIQGVRVYENGGPVAFDREGLSELMLTSEIAVRLDLQGGAEKARALGCDLTYDYVKINAEYYSSPKSRTPAAARAGDRSRSRGRGVELHPALRRQAGGHQVRRRGDDRSGAQAQLRAGGRAAAVGRPASDRRARRRTRDHAHARAPRPEDRVRRRAARDRRRGRARGRDGAHRQGQHRDRRACSTRWAGARSACRARTDAC